MEDPIVRLWDSVETPISAHREFLEHSIAAALKQFATSRDTEVTRPTGHHLGDIIINRGEGEPKAVIEVKLWPAETRQLRNRVAEALSQSARIRRSFPQEVQLIFFVAMSPRMTVPSSDARLGIVQRLSELLPALQRRGSDDAGFDRIIIGTLDPRNDRSLWLESQDTGLLVFDDFSAAVQSVSGSGGIAPALEEDRNSSCPVKFLLVADEWTSRTGGISTFNRLLAIALTKAGRDVYVMVPSADEAERDDATQEGVILVVPDSIPGVSGKELLLTKPIFIQENFTPDVVVGHGRILGPYAYAVRNQFYPSAKRLHIVHTDAESLELAKETAEGPSRMTIAEKRKELEVELALSADLVAGVGPLLANAIREDMRGARTAPPQVVDLRPGLRDWDGYVDPNDPPASLKVLFVGRAEDVRSKGVDIGVKAVSYAHAKWAKTARFPVTPELIIRGVPDDEADMVKQRIKEVDPNLKVKLRPYATSADTLRMDLFQSRVLIMPSRHEGFGLAAYEAIAAGVPVLITRNSGLAQMVSDVLGDQHPPEVLAIDGADDSVIAADWGEALYENFVNPAKAFERAKDLRTQIDSKLTWSDSAKGLIRALS